MLKIKKFGRAKYEKLSHVKSNELYINENGDVIYLATYYKYGSQLIWPVVNITQKTTKYCTIEELHSIFVAPLNTGTELILED